MIIDGNKVVDGEIEFVYLGSKLSSHTNSESEVTAVTAGVMEDLDDVWKQRSLSVTTKFCIYSTCVMSVLLYSAETWTLNKRMWAKHQAFHMQCQPRILSQTE